MRPNLPTNFPETQHAVSGSVEYSRLAMTFAVRGLRQTRTGKNLTKEGCDYAHQRK
jgi:hypothetical protein